MTRIKLKGGLIIAALISLGAAPPWKVQVGPHRSEKMFGAATNRIFDFGTVRRGTVLRHDFVLTNIYSEPVEITKIKVS
jgi:hypothetical protein